MSAPDASVPSACILLIGDELLSGKVRDENGHFLARTLRRRGIRLLEVRTVGDEPNGIGTALHDLLRRAPILFTSGGVGPTHDDRTLSAIASATGRALVRHVQMEAELRAHYGERLTEAALRMADVPEGTEPCAGPGWPVFRLVLPQGRLYILPGVPALFRAKVERLEALPEELPQGVGWHLADLYTTLEESRLAAPLDAVVARYPEVEIGSYPRFSRGDDGRVSYHVRVTFEAPAPIAERAIAARDELRTAMPAGTVLDAAPPGA